MNVMKVLIADDEKNIRDSVATTFRLEGHQAAVEAVEVDYSPMPMLTDPREAIKPGALKLHSPEDDDFRKNNILWEGHLRKGDVEEGFEKADVIIEGDYYTPFQEHGYEELECSIGVPEGDGVVVYCGSQGPTFDQEQIHRTISDSIEAVNNFLCF